MKPIDLNEAVEIVSLIHGITSRRGHSLTITELADYWQVSIEIQRGADIAYRSFREDDLRACLKKAADYCCPQSLENSEGNGLRETLQSCILLIVAMGFGIAALSNL